MRQSIARMYSGQAGPLLFRQGSPSVAKPALASCSSPSAAPHRPSRTFFTEVMNMGKGFGFGVKFGKPKMLNKKTLLVPRKISPRLPVPAGIQKPPYADSGAFPPWADRLETHDSEGQKRMRASGRLAAEVLEYAGTLVRPGITTDEIDKAVHRMCIERNAYPSPLNYGHYPKSVCISVNECVCHGIPDDRPLEEGDIVNVDVTVYYNGYHGDTSKMFFVGKVSEEAQKLAAVTKLALDEAIKICRPGVPYNMIGKTINNVADTYKFGVVKEYVGHGVGRAFHSAPTITHCRNNEPGIMQPWQTFTIEPMLVQGSIKCKTWADKWTVVTEDGGLCAQYEHTLLITPQGAEILTLLE